MCAGLGESRHRHQCPHVWHLLRRNARRIVDALKLGQITLTASPSIVEEYRRVGEDLESTYGELGAQSLVTFLAARAEIVDAPDLAEPVSRDPDDDKFLACALAASALSYLHDTTG